MSQLLEAIRSHREALLTEWLENLRGSSTRFGLLDETEAKEHANRVLDAIVGVSDESTIADINGAEWQPLKDVLSEISVARAVQGFTPSETALFVLALKPALFGMIRERWGNKANELFAEISVADNFIDRLGLHTTDSYISGRDQIIGRQQEDMLELSTPVVTLWDGIVALPLIGTLDSARTQVVMESLLQAIVRTDSRFAIIDITGVPTVDTLVAQHLLKTITAAKLMGAECILSGIRPQIAQTIVHLGINLEEVVTKAKLSDAFRMALERSNRRVVRVNTTAPTMSTQER